MRPAPPKHWLVLFATLLGLLSVLFTRAAPFAGALALIAFLAAGDRAAPKLIRYGSWAAVALSVVGLLRFTAKEALPGVVEAGKRASGGRAISGLRQVVFAQDVAREQATFDPDQDGIGSALFIHELAGLIAIRGRKEPILAPVAMLGAQNLDPLRPSDCLLLAGFCYKVCLPAKNGGWVSDPALHEGVDEELSERRFLAYAWPSRRDLGLSESFFIDEHEQILVRGDSGANQLANESVPCDDVLARPQAWKTWRNKKPRAELPGYPSP